jgi:hypothetical protein
MTPPIRTISAILTASVALLGCADKLLSDDRIRDNTALILNVPSRSLVISDRRYDGMENTYYTARTSRSVYSCRVDGGNAWDFGITNPPQCSRR